MKVPIYWDKFLPSVVERQQMPKSFGFEDASIYANTRIEKEKYSLAKINKF